MQDQAESQSAAMGLLDMATNGDEVLEEGYVSKHITSATDLGTVDTDGNPLLLLRLSIGLES